MNNHMESRAPDGFGAGNVRPAVNYKLMFLPAFALLLMPNPVRADYLPNNFWPNSLFESGTNLDAMDGSGTPTGWVRNGSDPTICQVTSDAFVSPTHAIMVNDNDGANYGEWDASVSLVGWANPGDTINVLYSEMYSVQGGEMRVAVVFLDAATNTISAGQFVVTGDSPGWLGSIAGSTFTETNQSLVVPIGAVEVSVGIVSGGPLATTGVLVVDDLSLARAPVPDLLASNIWLNASFESGTNLDQTNGTPAGWVRNGRDPTICQVTTNNYVSAVRPDGRSYRQRRQLWRVGFRPRPPRQCRPRRGFECAMVRTLQRHQRRNAADDFLYRFEQPVCSIHGLQHHRQAQAAIWRGR